MGNMLENITNLIMMVVMVKVFQGMGMLGGAGGGLFGGGDREEDKEGRPCCKNATWVQRALGDCIADTDPICIDVSPDTGTGGDEDLYPGPSICDVGVLRPEIQEKYCGGGTSPPQEPICDYSTQDPNDPCYTPPMTPSPPALPPAQPDPNGGYLGGYVKFPIGGGYDEWLDCTNRKEGAFRDLDPSTGQNWCYVPYP